MSDQPELEAVEEEPTVVDVEPAEQPAEEDAAAPLSKSYATPEMAVQADLYNSIWKVAGSLANTEFVPKGLRGDPAKVFGAMLTGHELGIGIMGALREIAMINGKAYLSASLRHALVVRKGHSIEGTAYKDRAEIRGTRADNGVTMDVVFTLEDAIQAGLVKVDDDGGPVARSKSGERLPWEKYVNDMLWSKAVNRLVDRLFPDVVVGESL